MIRKTFIVLVSIAGLLGSAQAALIPLESNYELGLNEVTLPRSSAGQVVIRQCADCDPEVLRVDGSTRYFLDNRSPVSLDELRAAADAVREPAKTGVYVFYKPETGVVTRIVLSLAG
jgi:hypothetical protein